MSSEKALVTITYAPYSNQLRDINPIGWFAGYVAIYVREVEYVKIKPSPLSKTAVVNLLLLMLTSKSRYERLLSFSVVHFSSSCSG